ncbi:MAG: alpha/beta hydrolase [Clostridia bacterium]|nr:alpha/beta hydrolase [Clostridia bacterium]
MRSYKDIVYKEIDGQSLALDIHIPECEEFSVFIFFHGGGLEAGDKDAANIFAPYLAENKIATVSANYRMYPKAEFPDYLMDSADVVDYVKKNISKYGKCDKIYLGGSSAGGYISMMLCFDDKYLGAHGIKPTDIAGYIHNAGQPTSHYNILRERKIDSRRVIVDDTAPLYFICEKEYSPMLFIVSEFDMTNRYEQTLLTMSTLRHFGQGDKISYKFMEGKRHCQYDGERDENSVSVLGKMILEFIKNTENK